MSLIFLNFVVGRTGIPDMPLILPTSSQPRDKLYEYLVNEYGRRLRNTWGLYDKLW
jgi:hypothetical protein